MKKFFEVCKPYMYAYTFSLFLALGFLLQKQDVKLINEYVFLMDDIHKSLQVAAMKIAPKSSFHHSLNSPIQVLVECNGQ